MDQDKDEELESLRSEVEQLRAENANLRANLRIGPTSGPQVNAAARPEKLVRVLLLPDPSQPYDGDGPGPMAAAGVARVLVQKLGESQPAFDWRAEHDLAEIPESALCFQLGEVAARMMGRETTIPRTFRVKRSHEEQLVISRLLISGEPDSDRFSGLYDQQLEFARDLMDEGQAAKDAGADHHAGWTLKAVDLITANLALAMVEFQSGSDNWRATLASPRPEYDPRYHVTADKPVGF